MRNVILSLLAVVISAGLFGCSKASSYSREGFDFSKVDKVAVVDVVGSLKSEGDRNQISDFFVMELLKKGYSPIERAQVQSLLKEHKFQASEITSNEDAAKAGRILNVPVVMIVNIPKFKEEMSITAKLIEVEDGSVLWAGSGSGTTGKLWSTIIGATAGAVAGASVAGDNSQTAGAVVGGVLGGAAGQMLSPQQSDKVQEIIGKICNEMPFKFKKAEKKKKFLIF